MPLSEEGSWIRVAIPDPGEKMFVMEWVFVPYGSILIRSLALYHGGHYGSPGNTRFHGMFTVKGAAAEQSKLSYLSNLGTRTEETGGNSFAGWKLCWNRKVPPECQGPGGYKRYQTERVKIQKNHGTVYYRNVVEQSATCLYPDLLRNLTPNSSASTQTKIVGAGGWL
jgi:hypothetical protein